MSQHTNTLYYISAMRFVSSTNISSEDLTGNHIDIGEERFLELVGRGRKRHSIRTLNSLNGEDTIVIVK
jgi:hypothetical protein